MAVFSNIQMKEKPRFKYESEDHGMKNEKLGDEWRALIEINRHPHKFKTTELRQQETM